MKRLVVLAAGLLSAGCTHDGEASFRKALGLEPARGAREKKEAVTVPKASREVAERVELVGRKVVAQNTFTGIEPMFTTIGVQERVLFHRGTEHLFISEGLVEKCQTDAELAAVLCAEMGQMVAEKRAAKSVRRDTDPIPDAGFGGNAPFPGGTAYNASQQANLAYHERQFPRGADAASTDATAAARELLKGAGYSPAELDRVEALLKQSERGEKLRKQLGGSAPSPTWQK